MADFYAKSTREIKMSHDADIWDNSPKTPEETAEAKNLIRELKEEDRIKNLEARDLFDSLRPEIRAFALAMEHTLRNHDGEKGDSWKECKLSFLCGKLIEEYKEFFEAPGSTETKPELVDIANVSMMIWNRVENL